MRVSWAAVEDCAGAGPENIFDCRIPIANLNRSLRSWTNRSLAIANRQLLMSKIIVLMGAPGAGKGTQARLLQHRLGLPQISTGDMFRALAQTQTPLAEEVRAIQQAGKLIPDELVIRVVEDRTTRDDCLRGYILDGFPRTAAQAEMLEELAGRQRKKPSAMLIDVPRALLGKRMTGQRICPVCKEIN